MATLATFFRRSDLITDERIETVEKNTPYRLRSLPGDNIYFYSKRIDNSHLVRQADPKTRTDCWSVISTVCVIAAIVATSVSPRIGSVLTGYQMEKIKAENRELAGRLRALEIERAVLVTPERLDAFAEEQKLASPAPGQETLLQPKDASLTMNVAGAAGTVSE